MESQRFMSKKQGALTSPWSLDAQAVGGLDTSNMKHGTLTRPRSLDAQTVGGLDTSNMETRHFNQAPVPRCADSGRFRYK